MDENPDLSQRAVGIYPRSTAYAVAEKNKVEIPVDLVNLTTSGDYFKFSVVNVPVAWVDLLPSPFIFLEHGEKKQLSLIITLPQGSAGTYDLKVMASRRSDATKAGEAHIELTVTTADAVVGQVAAPKQEDA